MKATQLNFIILICGFLLFAQGVSYSDASRVLELSDKFVEVYNEGVWLVMFYAPWCGHCKKLEPIWNNVAQSLYSSGIRVGRIDCTRFPAAATEFKVKGFPTVLFMKEGQIHPYNGDRTREVIVDFAQRMTAPPVQDISEINDFHRINETRQTFFAYVGEKEGPLWETYHKIAEEFQPVAWFYAVDEGCAKQRVQLLRVPAIAVFKDGSYELYEEPKSLASKSDRNQLETSKYVSAKDSNEVNLEELRDWVNKERFPLFVRITNGNFHQVMETGKSLVIAVLDEDKIGQIAPEMEEFRNELNKVAVASKDRFHRKFLFGWTGNPSLANSIAMRTLPMPGLLVINSSTYHHHIPDDEPESLTGEAITLFLEQILAETAPVYGGNGYFIRFYRMYYDAKTTLHDMWQGNPVLLTVLLGLPSGFLCLICYSICCSDMLEEEDELHEKTD